MALCFLSVCIVLNRGIRYHAPSAVVPDMYHELTADNTLTRMFIHSGVFLPDTNHLVAFSRPGETKGRKRLQLELVAEPVKNN